MLAFIVASVLAASVFSQSLVVDGGFESQTLAPWWTVTGTVRVEDRVTGRTGYESHSGQRFAVLAVGIPGSGRPSTSSLSQTLQTTSATPFYVLEFYLATFVELGEAGPLAILTVSWAGVDATARLVKNGTDRGYQRYTAMLPVPAGLSSELRFTLTGYDLNTLWKLDDVAVAPAGQSLSVPDNLTTLSGLCLAACMLEAARRLLRKLSL
jgi:hypothetical protein